MELSLYLFENLYEIVFYKIRNSTVYNRWIFELPQLRLHGHTFRLFNFRHKRIISTWYEGIIIPHIKCHAYRAELSKKFPWLADDTPAVSDTTSVATEKTTSSDAPSA